MRLPRRYTHRPRVVEGSNPYVNTSIPGPPKFCEAAMIRRPFIRRLRRHRQRFVVHKQRARENLPSHRPGCRRLKGSVQMAPQIRRRDVQAAVRRIRCGRNRRRDAAAHIDDALYPAASNCGASRTAARSPPRRNRQTPGSAAPPRPAAPLRRQHRLRHAQARQQFHLLQPLQRRPTRVRY